jgi:hypothetical protein
VPPSISTVAWLEDDKSVRELTLYFCQKIHDCCDSIAATYKRSIDPPTPPPSLSGLATSVPPSNLDNYPAARCHQTLAAYEKDCVERVRRLTVTHCELRSQKVSREQSPQEERVG